MGKKMFFTGVILVAAILVLAVLGILGGRESKNFAMSMEYSNLASESSLDEVTNRLSEYVNEENLETFSKWVKTYNEVAKKIDLVGDFKPYDDPFYDIYIMDELGSEENLEPIATNCRLNTYLLLKDAIEIPDMASDDRLLFLDNEMISTENLLEGKDIEKFHILFSRVETENTKDASVHAKKMESYFKNFKFNDEIRMISVVLHDNLEGDYLFIGHVGVMVPTDNGVLFIEKLSFEEPYQAIKFENEAACFTYLKEKYKAYSGEGLAEPFIMDNGKAVKF